MWRQECGLAADAAGTTRGDDDPFDWRGLAHVAHKSDVVRLLVLLREGGVYMDIHECSILPHQENQEFCVFNCTFSASDSTATNETISTTTQQTSMEVCTPLCIPLGKCALKLHVPYSWNVFSDDMCCLTPIHQITLASIYLW